MFLWVNIHQCIHPIHIRCHICIQISSTTTVVWCTCLLIQWLITSSFKGPRALLRILHTSNSETQHQRYSNIHNILPKDLNRTYIKCRQWMYILIILLTQDILYLFRPTNTTKGKEKQGKDNSRWRQIVKNNMFNSWKIKFAGMLKILMENKLIRYLKQSSVC